MVFGWEEGVDVLGNTVLPIPPPQENRTLVFLLRGSRLDSDLEFWQQVDRLLPKKAAVRLVAYCDGDACVDGVSRRGSGLTFPVIAYGEVTGAEAVLDADATGESILRSESWLLAKKIIWRGIGDSPAVVARKAVE